jgi:hypothetical protein
MALRAWNGDLHIAHKISPEMVKAGGPEIEITPAMIKTGADRLYELIEADVDQVYTVSEVFRAMIERRRQI